jgi:hypothetical protein
MSLFTHNISFKPIDPLGDGLGDDITTERMEPEAITLEEYVDEGQLSRYWQDVERDIENDPEWFKFSND